MRRWGSLVLVIVIVAACVIGVILRAGRRVTQELESLQGGERSALYQRTLAIMQNDCARPAWPTLIEHCREQARFLERFPECDASCKALTARYPEATR